MTFKWLFGCIGASCKHKKNWIAKEIGYERNRTTGNVNSFAFVDVVKYFILVGQIWQYQKKSMHVFLRYLQFSIFHDKRDFQ